MSTTVQVRNPLRVIAGGSLDVCDFGDIAAGCESVQWDGNTLTLTFAGTLTVAQQLRVRVRCIAVDDAQEQVLAAAAQAYYTNLDFLALPAPTAPQSVAQVKTLTEQVNGLLRFVTGL